MVNIIASKEVYKEYLQHFTPEMIKNDIIEILPDGRQRKRIEEDIASVVKMLSSSSGACEKAAVSILKTIDKQ
jgi:lipid A disaccharide synthetase